eukprot:716524_1
MSYTPIEEPIEEPIEAPIEEKEEKEETTEQSSYSLHPREEEEIVTEYYHFSGKEQYHPNEDEWYHPNAPELYHLYKIEPYHSGKLTKIHDMACIGDEYPCCNQGSDSLGCINGWSCCNNAEEDE